MHPTITAKTPQTQYGVASFITDRFSPRAFSDQPITSESIHRIFEAASWAPSANNEQPWEYHYALKGTEGFQKIWECLMPGNQPWAKNAGALAIAVIRKTFAHNGNPNGSALHDLGLANAMLLLQARSEGIFSHVMGGFERPKAIELLGLDENRQPVVVIALGYLGNPESLEEPFQSREHTPRIRKAVEEFAHSV